MVDLDHVGAERPEDLSAVGPGQRARWVEHAKSPAGAERTSGRRRHATEIGALAAEGSMPHVLARRNPGAWVQIHDRSESDRSQRRDRLTHPTGARATVQSGSIGWGIAERRLASDNACEGPAWSRP